jgi:hypothetical protein
MVGGKPAFVSQYRKDGIHNEVRGCNQYSVLQLAMRMGNHEWQPSRVYVLDLASTQDGVKVIEIGCWHCAGLYACDLHGVVASITKQALMDFGV